MWHETNTYSSRPTKLADFAAFELLEGEAIFDVHRGTGSVVGGFCDSGRFDLIPLFAAGAWPSGSITRDTLDHLLQRLAANLRSARQLDGLLVNLHGAMVADGCPDVEKRTLEVIREVAGSLPVAGVLDLHANVSDELVQMCNVLISYDTYPHVDLRERGLEAADLLAEILSGHQLRTWCGTVPILACPLAQATDHDPMAGLQRRAVDRGHRAGVRRVCVVGGFAYSDVERAGMSVLVVADARSEIAAKQVITETIADIHEHRSDFVVHRPDPAAAVREACASTVRPVILADVGDNIGGGSPGDGTALLAELLKQGARDAVVTIADPEVASLAQHLNVGHVIDAFVGGKTDALHGAPVRIRGLITRITDGRYRATGSWMRGHEFSMGTTAVIRVDGITLVVTERATPPFHAEQFSTVGIVPSEASVVVVKGAVAWRAALGDVAAKVIEVDTPGICPVNPSILPRTSRKPSA